MERTDVTPAVEVRELWKAFGDRNVLQAVNIAVQPGETCAIIGPSGSGKSTLCRAIVGLENPDAGEITLDGTWLTRRRGTRAPLEHCKNYRRRRLCMGMVFQHYTLFPQLTVLQNVTLAPHRVLGVSKLVARQRGIEVLERVGLGDKLDAFPSHLSGGQQQRAAIARELAMDRSILLFDEATSALDPELVSEVLKVIEELTGSGLTMVIVSHEMGFVRRAADKVVFMADGRVVEVASPEAFFEDPQQERSKLFLAQMA